jgi:CHASE3 domain sensor protein
MNWFVNLSTRTKLFLIFGFMVFFLLVVIAIAFNGLTTIRQSQDELFQQDFLSSIELV